MDEEEGEEAIGASVFHPSNNVIGLEEQLTKSPSSPSNEAANVGGSAVVDSDIAVSKNDGQINEVSQMLAVALQQIDTVIAGMYVLIFLVPR